MESNREAQLISASCIGLSFALSFSWRGCKRSLHLKDQQMPTLAGGHLAFAATILPTERKVYMNNRTSFTGSKWIVCAAILCLSFVAKGQSPNGKAMTSLMLREYCGLVGGDQTKLSDEEHDHINICLFYVSGVLDGFQIGDNTTKICIPEETSLGELALVVSKYLNQKYLNQYPERLHNLPQFLVIAAVHTAFPCKAAAHN